MIELQFERNGCKAFFKKHPQAKKVARQKIAQAIQTEIDTGMTKVKLATRQKLNGQSCYEMRLNLGKVGSVRIAFTVNQNQSTIYYLTTTLQKSAFSNELNNIIRE